MTRLTVPAKTVLIGVAHGQVVALPEDWAYEYAQLKKARETSATWAEFKRQCPAGYWTEIREGFAGSDRRPPRGAAKFEWCAIRGVEDGDWPIWPEQEMLSWIPTKILREVGEQKMSTLNGDFAHVPAAECSRLIDLLTRAGFHCLHRQEFISYVCDA